MGLGKITHSLPSQPLFSGVPRDRGFGTRVADGFSRAGPEAKGARQADMRPRGVKTMTRTCEITEGVLGATGMVLMIVLWCLVVVT